MEPRVKLYVPTEESFPILLKYIDVTRTTHTSLDVLLEKHIEDFWNVDEDRELSDAWTGCTRFILLNERPLDGYTWSGGRLTRKHTTSRPDNVCQTCKAKQRWAVEKPKLDNARQVRGIFFIESDARRRLEIPMPAAMPCKTPINGCGETFCGIGKSKTKHACIDESDESTRTRLEALFWYHEDHIATKGINSLNHYNLGHKFIPMPQAIKHTRCEGCSEERMGKLGKDTRMAADESHKQKRGDR